MRGLKSFSRLDEDDLKQVDVHEGIDSTLTLLNNNIARENITLTKEYGNLPEVECYPGKINQVFMNILNNAIQAVGSRGYTNGEGAVAIKTKVENNHVVISIKDNGNGIPEKNKEKIFEPFFTTKQVGSGTGLGLSIVYTIIKGHYGDIKVLSEEGKGAEFVITLPVNHSKQ